MSTGFIFALILIMLALCAFPFAVRMRHTEDRAIARIAAVTLAALGGLLIVISSFTMVSPRTVAIATEFGKPTASFGNGLHMVAPWAEVTEMDGAVQTDSHVGKHCTKVRLAHQSVGCVDNTVKWRIVAEEADQLFLDYREFDKIRDSLVTRELGAALNAALADFDPLTTEGQPTQKVIADKVQDILQGEIGDRVKILSVITPLVRFDADTQKRIDALQVAIADTRIANQRKDTATADAKANRILANSVSRDPNVLVARCLDQLDKLKSLPAGFQCWPGGGTPLVVGAK